MRPISEKSATTESNHQTSTCFVLYTQDPTKLLRSRYEVATKSLRSCNEVATKLDPSRIPCASPASPHPSIKESTKGGGRRRQPHPFVEAARSATSFMDGCVGAGEAADAAETHVNVRKTCTCMHTLVRCLIPMGIMDGPSNMISECGPNIPEYLRSCPNMFKYGPNMSEYGPNMFKYGPNMSVYVRIWSEYVRIWSEYVEVRSEYLRI